MKRNLIVLASVLGVLLLSGGLILASRDGTSDAVETVRVPGLASDPGTAAPPSTPTHAAPAAPHSGPPLSTGETATEGGGVKFTFDGAPASPEPFYWMPGWDVQVHSRDSDTWEQLEAIEAQHGPHCEAPNVSHTVTEYEAAVFQCRDHLMTAVNAGGYAMIYLTPPYLADFSKGEAVIRFDISTLVNSKRDWWDVWLTPYDANLALPLDDWLPDAQGEPRDGIHIKLGTEMQVCPRIIKNHEAAESPTCKQIGYNTVLTPDPARRDTVEIHISRDHVKVGMPKYNLWWDDANTGGLTWDPAVVQFGHHSYNPTKDNSGVPGTWHWDNFEITPAAPFSIVRAQQRSVEDDGTVSLESPAPADAMLRFSALGTVELSFDHGASWNVAQRQDEEGEHREHMSSYWTPIPAGTQQVQFRFKDDDWYKGPFIARDISVWSQSSN